MIGHRSQAPGIRMKTRNKVAPPVTPRIVRTQPGQQLFLYILLLCAFLLAVWFSYDYGRTQAPAPTGVAVQVVQPNDATEQRITALEQERDALKQQVTQLQQRVAQADRKLRAARAQAKLKVRQPLSKVEVILAESHKNDADWLVSHADLVCNELNVKAFEICRQPDTYITRTILPDLKKLGPRLGKKLPQVKNALQQADATTLMTAFRDHGSATVSLADGTDVSIREEDCIIRTTARDGWAAAEGTRGVVIISSELTPELLAEGQVREVIHAVQSQRKTLDLEFTDRIELGFATFSHLNNSRAEERVK